MIQINFKKLNGLIPAIAQDYKSNKILMLAFMNKEALKRVEAAEAELKRAKEALVEEEVTYSIGDRFKDDGGKKFMLVAVGGALGAAPGSPSVSPR